MPAAVNTLLIEGTFEELCDELAVYLDGLNTAKEQQSSIQSEIQTLLQEEKKDEVLKKIVTATPVLNSAPERGVYKSTQAQSKGLYEGYALTTV